MNIYEVHYDNGEYYEDACNYSEAFFSSYEGAVTYLKEKGCNEYEGCWYPKKYVCAVKSSCDCDNCEYDCCSDCFNEDKFVSQFGEHCRYDFGYGSGYLCPEKSKMMDAAYDNSFYRIIKHEVYS